MEAAISAVIVAAIAAGPTYLRLRKTVGLNGTDLHTRFDRFEMEQKAQGAEQRQQRELLDNMLGWQADHTREHRAA